MEIFMTGIEFTANRYEVTFELAKVLHDHNLFSFRDNIKPSLSTPAERRPINFKVTLNEGHSGIRNDGTGYLMLPDFGVATRFLRLSEKRFNVLVHGRKIRFSKSRRKLDVQLIQTLGKLPYQDPSIDQERDEKVLQFDRDFRVDKLQFGVWSQRPLPQSRGIFCSEWERSYTSIGNAQIRIEYTHKLLRLQLGDPAQDEIAYRVVFKFSNLQNIWIGHDFGNPFVCFDLLTPPILEFEWFNRAQTGIIEADSRKFRQRIGFIDPKHAVIAPYAHQVLLTLYQSQDLEDFARLCRLGGLRRIARVDVDSESRNLFSQKRLAHIAKWFESLQWSVAFQLEACLHNGFLHTEQLLEELRRPIDVFVANHSEIAGEVLRHFNEALQSLDPQANIVSCFEQTVASYLRSIQNNPLVSPPALSSGIFRCYHVTFSPTRMTLEGPYVTQSNRVVRMYPAHHNHFLRVDFRDEDRLQYRWDREVDGKTFLNERVGGILKSGFILAGRRFQFLAYSSSALRDHSVWFMHPFDHPTEGHVTPSVVRRKLGDFSGNADCPSKYAARLAQAFTATDPSVTITRSQWKEIPDMGRKPYEFTDGVGTISKQLRNEIWTELCKDRHDRSSGIVSPSAFQIRFLGYKGMVSVDEELKDIQMCLRPSMNKFSARESGEAQIEIARAFEKPGRMYLNRQLIMILEDRGVSVEAFMALQDEAVADAQTAHDSVSQLSRLLLAHGLGATFKLSRVMTLLATLGLDLRHPDPKKTLDNPFFNQVIHCAVSTVLRDIKHSARIPVPDSYKLVGVADEGPAYVENGCQDVYSLQDGEVFVCVQENNESEPRYLKGNAVISRSPTVHPGDVQRVWAIGRPPSDKVCSFRNLKNVIVLPSQGKRSLASCLGGGDLDGDLFDISLHPRMLPTEHAKAADYPDVQKQRIDISPIQDENGDIQDDLLDDFIMQHVCDFIVEYINSDVLGLLSDNHLIRADQSADGVHDPGCLVLARLCSQAVDYPKNGKPVDVRSAPRRLLPYKPDWKLSEEDIPRRTDFYESTRAVGILYREIEIHRKPPVSQTPRPVGSPITSALYSVLPQYVHNAPGYDTEIEDIFRTYADELRYICVTHTLSNQPGIRLKEEEIVVGSILAQCSQQRWRRERIFRMRLHASDLVRSITDKFLPRQDHLSKDSIQTGLTKAWQAWKFAMDNISKPNASATVGFNSFGLVALNVILDALERLESL